MHERLFAVAALVALVVSPSALANPDRNSLKSLSTAYELLQAESYLPLDEPAMAQGAIAEMFKAAELKDAPPSHRGGPFLDQIRDAYSQAARGPKSLSAEQLEIAALRGMSKALGDAVMFMPPAVARQASDNTPEYAGIGIQIKRSVKNLWIMEVFDGSPASRAGVRADDRIMAIDGKPAATMPIEDAVKAIRGPVGSTVTLTIGRDKLPEQPVVVTRGKIEISEISSHTIDGIRYIKIHSFNGDKVASDIKVELSKTPAPKAIVLDLRRCYNGLVKNIPEIVALFADRDTMFVLKNKAGHQEVYTPLPGRVVYPSSRPLAVLIDKTTFGGAELIAAGLRETRKALLFGSKTDGGGYYQTVRELPNGSFLAITTDEAFLKSGVPLKSTGLIPDIETPPIKTETVETPKEKLPPGVDRQSHTVTHDIPLTTTLRHLKLMSEPKKPSK